MSVCLCPPAVPAAVAPASVQVDCRKVLWELLVLMAKHQGQLKVSYSPAGAGASAKAAGLLRGAVTAAAGAAVSAATSAAAAGAGGSDADGRAPGSGAGTPRAGAGAAAGTAAGGAAGSTGDGVADSELLRVLTPELASAAGAASGMRILSHQVPEMELQATATEMQVGGRVGVVEVLVQQRSASVCWLWGL